MVKMTWRDRLKAHGFKFFTARWGYMGGSKRGDYVSGRRADVVISTLEREIVNLTSERDEALAEVERLRAGIAEIEGFNAAGHKGTWRVEEWKIWKGLDPINPRWGDLGFACATYDDAVGLMDYELKAFPQRIRRVVFDAWDARKKPKIEWYSSTDVVPFDKIASAIGYENAVTLSKMVTNKREVGA